MTNLMKIKMTHALKICSAGYHYNEQERLLFFIRAELCVLSLRRKRKNNGTFYRIQVTKPFIVYLSEQDQST